MAGCTIEADGEVSGESWDWWWRAWCWFWGERRAFALLAFGADYVGIAVTADGCEEAVGLAIVVRRCEEKLEGDRKEMSEFR